MGTSRQVPIYVYKAPEKVSPESTPMKDGAPGLRLEGPNILILSWLLRR